MTYEAPSIDESGLHIPTYPDYENYLVTKAKDIFGQDIYLGNDSQDFQWIAAIAQLLYDTALSAQLAYNNRGPVGAIGVGLDGIVALNGIQRNGQTYSTCTVQLTGTAFTQIVNGVVADVAGNQWNLPALVTLDGSGNASEVVTCQVPGPITALSGQITVIVTPTSGWLTVNNATAATAGRAQETDSALRSRQMISVANPSQALTTGILGAVYAVANVRSAQLYENDTSAPVSSIGGVVNPGDYPAHSITLVVDGGTNEDVASAIALRKTPGCFTDGDVSVVIYDQYSVPTTIRFYRPTTVPTFVELTIKALNGYTSATGAAIKQALVDYINSLVAGQSIIISELWQAALNADPQPYPVFSLTELGAYIISGAPGTTDIALYFNQQAITELDNISLVVT